MSSARVRSVRHTERRNRDRERGDLVAGADGGLLILVSIFLPNAMLRYGSDYSAGGMSFASMTLPPSDREQRQPRNHPHKAG